MPDPVKVRVPSRNVIFGDNSKTRFGSDGLSSTQAFGANYRSYYYHTIRTETEIQYGDYYSIGFLFFRQKRRVVHRYTYYYLQTRAKDGTLINEKFVHQMHEQDFDAWGFVFGAKQKDAFHEPNGFGAFATEFADNFGSVDFTISVKFGGNKEDKDWGEVSFFAHHNQESAAKASDRIDHEILARQKINLASDVRNAILKMSGNQRLVDAGQLRLISDQLGLQLPENSSEVNVVSGPNDTTQINSLIQVGGSDLLAIGAGNITEIVDIYNKIDKEGLTMSLISVTDRSYSVQVGKQYTSQYLMQFAKDAYNLQEGIYEIVDIDIVSVKQSDWLGNQYNDPDGIYLSIPAAEIIIYLQHKSND